MPDVPKMPSEVAAVFASFPQNARAKLTELRTLIFETAAATDGVGAIEETLKWSEPAYLTSETKSGTTIRLGWKTKQPETCFFFVHCQTTLIEQFRSWFSDALAFEGTRAIAFPIAEALPTDIVRQCIEAALTYHSRK